MTVSSRGPHRHSQRNLTCCGFSEMARIISIQQSLPAGEYPRTGEQVVAKGS